jgi:hypothetical protein
MLTLVCDLPERVRELHSSPWLVHRHHVPAVNCDFEQHDCDFEQHESQCDHAPV